MKNLAFLFVASFGLMSASCAHEPNLTKITDVNLNRAVVREQKQLGVLRDENLILRRRVAQLELRLHGRTGLTVAPSVEIEKQSATAEHLLYAKVLQSYRARNLGALLHALHMLQRFAPRSPHLDNAYFLVALYQMSQHDWVSARRWVELLVKKFPLGNKVVSALFVEAMADRNLGEPTQSRFLLAELSRDFPGSAEAQQASVELRIFRKQRPVPIRAAELTKKRRWMD